ncbi:hypothetical protein BDW74DRAFT_14249 [Aspergillus multicolor]|uniref:uncharacterized protein n=1 Tax=Aspergillus multicolor TaxID=41759 RepID=UPI003CCD2D88
MKFGQDRSIQNLDACAENLRSPSTRSKRIKLRSWVGLYGPGKIEYRDYVMIDEQCSSITIVRLEMRFSPYPYVTRSTDLDQDWHWSSSRYFQHHIALIALIFAWIVRVIGSPIQTGDGGKTSLCKWDRGKSWKVSCRTSSSMTQLVGHGADQESKLQAYNSVSVETGVE